MANAFSLNIAVCIKQVPDSSGLRINPGTGNLDRSNAQNVINPYDLFALEAASDLKKSCGGTITAVCMGPPQAESALREALARGADKAVHVCGPAFSGSDTWATSLALASTVLLLDQVNLVLCGKQAVDGDTAQVGPGIAAHLNWPHIAFALRIRASENVLTGECSDDSGNFSASFPLPGVVTLSRGHYPLRRTSLQDWSKALQAQIRQLGPEEIGLEPDQLGIKGSPTRVRSIKTILFTKKTEFFRGSAAQAAEKIESFFRKKSSTPFAASPVRLPDPEKNCRIFVTGEIRKGRITPVTYELAAKALELSDEVSCGSALVFVTPASEIPVEVNPPPPADKVFVLQAPSAHPLDIVSLTAALADFFTHARPDIILGGATAWGRSLMPRLSVLLRTGLTADCTALTIDGKTGDLLQTRPAFGGNILATITCNRKPQMATVRPGVFKEAFAGHWPDQVCLPVPDSIIDSGITIMETSVPETPGNSLAGAAAVAAGGMGLGSDGFKLLEEFSILSGAAVGASRSAVDAGWAGLHCQVGQTGRTVQPALYMAFGISGAVQHLAGMQSSGFIISINRDPESAIFGVSDLAIIGDCKEILRALITRLRNRKNGSPEWKDS
ncbi:MAG: FAD-binding protein [Candidatus Wallbacteria bacterium]|nr:FAD-binding protein [Candidatus Wallbacteria bacterium]